MRGKLIKHYRTRKGYTQAHVAYLLGMEESTYSRSERNGVGLDSVEKLCVLAQVLEIDFVELVYVGCPQSDPSREVLFDRVVYFAALLRDFR